MKKLIIIVLLLAAVSIFADEKEERHNVGFSAGELTRSGVSYRYWINSWGINLTGMLTANDDGVPDYYDFRIGESQEYTYFGYGRELNANFGISIMKVFKRNNLSKFYGFLGYGIKHKEQELWASEYPDISSNWGTGYWNDGYKVSNTHYYGLGLGVDFELLEYFRGYIEIPLTFESNGDISMYVPQAGILYKF